MKYIKLFESYKNPIDKLKNIINDLLSTHNGGISFFGAFDDSMRDSNNEDIIIEMFKNLKNNWIISSGGFGDTVYKMWEDGKIKCLGMLIFNGKMYTRKKGVTSWYPHNFDISNKDYVFVDDSLFTGNTYKKIDDYLRSEYESQISKVCVIYDGSRQKNSNVESLFRYYDNNTINEAKSKNPKFNIDLVEFLYDLSIELDDTGLYTDIKYRNWKDQKCKLFNTDKKEVIKNLIEVRLYAEDKKNVLTSKDDESDWLVSTPIINKIIDRLSSFGYTRSIDYKIYGGWKAVNIVFGEFSY
jgi:hypothetical protein